MVLVEGEHLPGGPERFVDALAAEGILVGYMRPGLLRFCTHRDVDQTDVERVAAVAAGLRG
jgi:hypothetical protein